MPTIAQYQANDYDGVIALYKNKAAYGGSFDAVRDTRERLLATSREDNLYIAREGGTVVGTFMILDNPHSFWLLRFAVDPALPNAQDVAIALLIEAQELAARRGHTTVIAYTDNDDPMLNQRYQDLGFHQAASYRCYWKEVQI